MGGISQHTAFGYGKSSTWLTPPSILKALGPFDLDPACPVKMPWRTASKMLTPIDDGLVSPWSGRVWLNPPYGVHTSKWLEKLHSHGNGIALIFGRTETKIFFPWIWDYADGVFFFRGRLHFHLPDGTRSKGNSGGPSVLVAYGKDNTEAIEKASLDGRLVRLNNKNRRCRRRDLP